MTDLNIGKLIHDRRIELGLTMKELADKVGVSEGTISRWESGEIKNMRRDAVANLAKALLINPKVLMDWDDDEPSYYVDPETAALAQELKDGQHRQEDDPDAFAAAQPDKQDQPEKEKPRPYSGPSVLSWSLDGRNASHLPIPAYRCYGAGEVTVIITVNNRGDVVNAKVDDKLSTPDGCLRTFAVRAARLSRFSASSSAPARQMGTITYAFIAQ